MSADPLKKHTKQACSGHVVLPQAVSDPSLLESVAGFIHEVVPQAYSSVLPGESKDGILWARFETVDYNDPENYSPLGDCESQTIPPILLVLGYSTGVQVWSIAGSGEATELFSWCQGAVKTLRFLYQPQSRDPYSSKRPLVAIVDSGSQGIQFASMSLVSLRNAEVVKIIKFSSPICDVHCNKKVVVVALNEKIAVFDLATFEERLTITTCYPSPGNSCNPIALGTRWLAFASTRLMPWERSSGGCVVDGAQSYTSTLIHAAKSIGLGILELGGSLTGSSQSNTQNSQTQANAGIVTIVDIEQKKTIETQEEKIVAHFIAHVSAAIVAMTFDPSGVLLITADKHGHRFNVFRIHSHPCTAQLSAVHHLYVLHRGDTTARVQDIAVSWDSRWVAVLSERGTTHVFPITPYGGITTVRTHASFHVANKLSSFEHSSGIKEGIWESRQAGESTSMQSSPRLPPYPHPYLVNSLAQLRARPDDAPLAAWFGPPRAWIPGRPQSKKTFADSLYVIFSSGSLLQYDLDPMAPPGLLKHQICYSTKIDLKVDLKAEWVLPRPPTLNSVSPPLPLGHVLLDPPSKHQETPDQWLSQVEIETHTGPHRRLWMGPQFSFKAIDLMPISGEEGTDIGPDSGNPLRSSPDMAHRPFLLVEIGSGSPQMGYIDEAGGRLKDDLADAMLETHISTGQTKGKLRRAEVEWQVNPLGAVQTHPVIHSHWAHPIYFEPYSQDHVKSEEQPTTKKIVKTLLERSNMEEQPSDTSFSFGRNLSVSDTSKASVELVLSDSIEAVEPSYMCSEQPSCSASIDSVELLNCKKPFSSCLLKSKDEQLVEEENKSGLTEFISVKKVSISENISSENSSNSVTLVSEPLETLEKVSSVQEIEEKPKLTGRKGKKKKNGNEKKVKKEQVKTIHADENKVISCLGSQKVDAQAKEEKMAEIKMSLMEEIMQEDAKCDLAPITVPDVFDIDDELRDISMGDQLLFDSPISIGEDLSGPKLSGVGLELLLPHVSSSDPILFGEKIDPLEEEISPPGKAVPLFEETLQRKKNSDHYSNTPCEFLEISPDDLKEQLQIKDFHGSVIAEGSTLESPALLVGEALLEEELELSPLTYDTETDNAVVTETIQSGLNDDKDLNGNNSIEEKNLKSEKFDIASSAVDESYAIIRELSPRIITSISPNDDVGNTSLEPEKELIHVSCKSTRNKNRRRKKEKKQEQVSHSELSEIESSESIEVVKGESSQTEVTSVECTEGITSVESESVCVLEVIGKESAEEPHHVRENTPISADKVSLEDEVTDLQVMTDNSMKECLKSFSEAAVSSLILYDEVQSDQVVSTDKSEIEDVSSHSGKESDDSKINKKERSRKQKRSESSDKDRSEFKKKSPSPATIKLDNKDSESSDEAGQLMDNKQPIPKVPKRKKGKKNEEIIPEVPSNENAETKECPATSKGITQSVKYKSSESSLESSGENRASRHPFGRAWNPSASNSDPQFGVEDRDSVYESCNDDGASDSLAFESSKEDFDDGSSKNTTTEPSSSNTEDKADTNDKSIQPSKKVKKQKKKKRWLWCNWARKCRRGVELW